MSNILVLGGTGFVGRHVCESLQRAGHRMTVPTRVLKNAAPVQHLPGLTVQVADVHQPDQLNRLVAGHDLVINLVAILHGNERAFRKVHVDLPESLAAACAAAGVRRVIHVSALGAAADAPSLYLRSKAAGEAVLEAADLDLTVLRPSVIFGAGDHFINLFARMQQVLPLVPLAGARVRFQPVWVQDVAQAIVHAVAHPDTIDQTLEATGPDVYTLAQLVRLAGQAVGCPRPVLALPTALAYFQALLMELLPGTPLMSTDNISSLEVDNVASETDDGQVTLADWGLTPAHLEDVLPTFLHQTAGTLAPRERLVDLRAQRRR
ncbi:MAG TPA: complex I NDUFA9 subunit family protein [Burkholderiaceae bacterium]|nr:complex I NDUFA9 subunit family protein [Burkholderiaceae bacterium]